MLGFVGNALCLPSWSNRYWRRYEVARGVSPTLLCVGRAHEGTPLVTVGVLQKSS